MLNTDPPQHSNTTLEAARQYRARGIAVIPVPYKKKGAILPDWPRLRLKEGDLVKHFGGDPTNIGGLLGDPSGGLADADIDCVEALRVARAILPETGLVTGRKSSPRSHQFYISPGLKTRKFQDPEGPTDTSMIVELRSTGCQTLFPPSVHPPEGETYEFYSNGEPAVVAAEDLSKVVSELAAVALLARHWPAEGGRQDAALSLAGALLRTPGFDVERVQAIVRWVCTAAEDLELGKRVAAVQITADRIARDETAWGFPKLAELVGKKVASRALDWLNADDQQLGDTQHVEELNAAREVLEALPVMLKQDPGAAFEDSTVGALALVKARDPAAWTRAKTVLRRADVSIKDVEMAIRKCTGAGLRVVEPGEQAGLPTVADMLGDDCPAPQLEIPDGFSLRRDATIARVPETDPLTRQEVLSDVVIAHAPILIAGKVRDVDEGTELLDLRYLRPAGWQQLIADRGVVMDSRHITALASRGFPVASPTAKEVVSYLHALEGLNFERIPASQSTSHLGWQGPDGGLGFLVGRQLVQLDGSLAPLTGAREGPGGLIGFFGAASGDEQIADAIHPRGSMSAWLCAVKVIANFPRVLIGFYGAFVPPILKIIRGLNFILDWAGWTSSGKSTVLRVGASAWGNPSELEADSLLGCWDSTNVFVERASAVLSGLPTFLDESQRAKDSRAVANVLYEAAHGRGRSRGNTKSLSRTKTWRTVLFSSGELPATSFTNDGGTRARCMEIRGLPFARKDKETARLVIDLNLQISGNYGHAGLEFVQSLMIARDRWEDMEQDYRRRIGVWSGKVPEGLRVDPAIVSRLAQYIAAVELAALHVHRALDLPWSYRDPLEQIWGELVAESSEATGDERALRDVISWAHSHPQSFFGRHLTDMDERLKIPPAGLSGRWDSKDDWEFIGFYPTVLDRVLREFGYKSESVLEGWKHRGWLDIGPSSRYQKRMRILGENPYLVVIRRPAVEEAEA